MILSITFALKGHTEFGDGGLHGLHRGVLVSGRASTFVYFVCPSLKSIRNFKVYTSVCLMNQAACLFHVISCYVIKLFSLLERQEQN